MLIDHKTKGIPGGVVPFQIHEIPSKKWNVLREDLPLPLAVLRQSAIEHNSSWMCRFLELSGAAICPHGKTTMSPDLFARQLADGAWGITVATVNQLQVARDHGIRRAILANQLIGKQAIRYVIDELESDPEFDFYCLVDSREGVQMLAEAAQARRAKRPIQVLLEGGFEGGRSGCRRMADAMAVAHAIAEARPRLALRGVEGFEGIISRKHPEDTTAYIRNFLDFLIDIALNCEQENLFAPGAILLSAGGSSFYDLVVERFKQARLCRDFLVLTRSGCYLSHDTGSYAQHFQELLGRSHKAESLGPGLQAALEVWAYVQSRPEPSLAILTMGKRDCSYDSGMPVPLKWYRPAQSGRPQELGSEYVVTALNDQHAYLQIPDGSPLRVGDMVGCGISHPCTTFDKWRVLMVVNDDYDVVSAYRTFF